MSSRIATVLFASAAFLVACGDERIDPAPQPTETNTPDGGDGGAPPEPLPAVREVYERNPIGIPIDNLMVDGDFELSLTGQSNSQAPWFAFKSNGAVEVPMLAETGGLCHTGLRCAQIPARTDMLGWGTSAANEVPHRTSIWLKPVTGVPGNPDRPCELADVYIIDCMTFDLLQTLEPAEKPDESGWCEHKSDFEGSKTGICMYVSVNTVDILVDSAVILPAPDLAEKSGAASPRGPRPQPLVTSPSASNKVVQTQRAAVEMRDFLRKRREIGRGGLPRELDPRTRPLTE